MPHRRTGWAAPLSSLASVLAAVLVLVAIVGMHAFDSRFSTGWEPEALELSPADPDVTAADFDEGASDVHHERAAVCGSCIAVVTGLLVGGPTAGHATIPAAVRTPPSSDLGPTGPPP